MEFIKTKLEGLLIIQPKVFGDNRGCTRQPIYLQKKA